jgi:hypothetical protein
MFVWPQLSHCPDISKLFSGEGTSGHFDRLSGVRYGTLSTTGQKTLPW